MTMTRQRPRHPFGQGLRRYQEVPPDHVVAALAASAATIEATDLQLLIVDYEQGHLIPVGDGPGEPVSVRGSLADRALDRDKPVAVEQDGSWTVYASVRDRGNRLGVLSLRVPDWDAEIERFCMELGLFAALLVQASWRHTDQLHRARWRAELPLAAQIQWDLLPPVVCETSAVTISGLLVPAHDVGGDCFDYSLNGDTVDCAIFDAMGHGLAAAILAVLTVGAYRHARRAGLDLPDMVTTMNAAIEQVSRRDAFSTALMYRLDTRTGLVRWVSAGHPAPILMRDGRTEQVLGAGRSLLGMLTTEQHTEVNTLPLQPGDCLLLYSDGVTEARSPGGDWFGEQRLRSMMEREVASGHRAPEVQRRLLRAVADHQAGPLRDDAALVYLHWHGPDPA